MRVIDGTEAAPRRTVRPLLAAVALAGAIAGAGTAVVLHHRAAVRPVAPAVSPPAAPTPLAPATLTPVPRPAPYNAADAAWDSTHAEMVVVLPGDSGKAGYNPSAVWTWNGSWQPHGDAGLPTRQSGVLADMPPLHGVVLLGDPDVSGAASWRWDGAAWRQIAAPPYPANYGPNAAAYDAQRHELVVLVGTRLSGDMASPPPDQTWTWDGRTWTRRGDAPQTAGRPPMAWDPEARSVVIAGSPWYSVTSVGHAQAWTWTGSGWRRYGSAATFDLPSLARSMAWDASAHGLVLYAEATADDAHPATVLLAGGRWQTVAPLTFPEHVGVMVEDTTRNRALLVGTAPISAPQTPSASTYNDPDTVLTWDGRGWTEATAAP